MPVKRLFVLLAMVFGAYTALPAQKTTSEFQFGMHVTHPSVHGRSNLVPAWSSNYFLGFCARRKINAENLLHYGVVFNFINYRVNESGSTWTSFSTINSFSFPVQSEFRMTSKIGLLLGAEARWNVNAIEFNSTSGITRRMPFVSGSNGYQEYNLGLRAGLTYKREILNYFLQVSTELFPYKKAGSVEFFDQKISFGFTLFPLQIRKR